jgi:hypothetical protein
MSGLAEDELDESPTRQWLRRIGVVVLLLALAYGGLQILNHLSGKPSARKAMTTVKLLPDTPPPPPPPPPPKEQPKEQPKEIKVEPPKQETPQPPAEALKMEGAAGDGPSPFAAGTVSNDYKGGPVEPVKIGGGTNIRQFSWYTGMLKSQIEDAMAKDKKLAKGDYKVVVKVWVSKDGHIERYELSGTSGKPETDELIKTALGEMPPLSEGPPQDMPQPVKLRITARSTG